MSSQQKPGLSVPLTGRDQLLDYFERGCRPAAEWGVGAEMEQLVIDAQSGEAADFARVEQLLIELARVTGWREMVEGERVIGLIGPHSSVTLEPGGQLELSGQLCSDLCCNHADFMRHVERVVSVGSRLGLAFLGLGTQPFTPLEQIGWVPKARYAIMGPYMLHAGDMGVRMMKQSAGLQVNLDYSDEGDCMAKLRLAQALAPLLYALFANSPLLDGQPSGFLSSRGEIWSRTDPDRSGLLPFLDNPDAGFADYIDYALAVPMYFIVRDGAYIDLTQERFTFRDYLDQGVAGYQPTLSDWDTHLSTLFPEVRLRPQIEVRSADSLPPRLALSVAALLKGLLYDAEIREMTWDLCRPASQQQLRESCRAAWTTGLGAAWGDGTLTDLARHCLALARTGLARDAARRGHGKNETIFLEGLVDLIESGRTLAEQLLAGWQGDRQDKLKMLIAHGAFSLTGENAPPCGCKASASPAAD